MKKLFAGKNMTIILLYYTLIRFLFVTVLCFCVFDGVSFYSFLVGFLIF